MEEAAKDHQWVKRREQSREVSDHIRRGTGVASMWYGIGFGTGINDTTDVIVELHEDGKATAYVGTVDYGNGSNTTFAMMAAESLGLKVSDINMVSADTDRTKNCGSTVATKQTYTTGNAVLRACEPLRRDMVMIAADVLDAPKDDIRLGDGYVWVEGAENEKRPIADIAALFGDYGKPMRREGIFKAHELTEPLHPKTGQGGAWFPMAFGTQMAEVEVNTKTGKVSAKEITAAHYVGRTINPKGVRGQVVGGISMGVGMALWEDSDYVDGVPQATNFDKYRLMRSKDYPLVRTIAVEHDDRTGPFGAIGIGEPPTIPTAAAIANAVYDAIGVRIRDLPITKEKVLAGLREKDEGEG